MITIEHFQGYVAGSFDIAIDDFIYAIGEQPPNFPMPAIPLEVYFAPKGVSINRKYEWLFYRRCLRIWNKPNN